ncbi:TetR/AcrR family transcriptional regulator [Pseudomonas sp. NY15181]|uniref:TetR/AcrR family transcriptional regulator n=1 Tax=Pseudomonas sp. NY15181 TaxID=3400349 RepID=UPI003A8621B7
MTMLSSRHPDLFAPLASALADHPRISLQALAKAIGISKPTLHRLYGTREELIERLVARAVATCGAILREADLANAPPQEALRRMIHGSLGHSELATFLMHHCNGAPVKPPEIGAWEAELDAFFLRGQREKVFRIDVPAPVLTELWSRLLIGILNAVRRGRVARASLADLIETSFLHGAVCTTP